MAACRASDIAGRWSRRRIAWVFVGGCGTAAMGPSRPWSPGPSSWLTSWSHGRDEALAELRSARWMSLKRQGGSTTSSSARQRRELLLRDKPLCPSAQYEVGEQACGHQADDPPDSTRPRDLAWCSVRTRSSLSEVGDQALALRIDSWCERRAGPPTLLVERRADSASSIIAFSVGVGDVSSRGPSNQPAASRNAARSAW